MQDFYESTNGESWAWRDGSYGAHWEFSSSANPCVDHWQGLRCANNASAEYNHIIGINLTSFNLVGSLSDTIESLTKLESLALSNNSIGGTIPSSLGNIEPLQTIILLKNRLHGSIPSSLGNLLHLDMLDLKNNSLAGPLPPSLGNLHRLTILDVYINTLTGPIPDSYSNLTYLQYVDLYNNSLTGTIPSFLGRISNLTYLYLGENAFTGTIPDSIGDLKKLISFYANSNYLVGTVPSGLALLSELQYLFLYQNNLCGAVTALFNPAVQTALSVVLLYENQFTGSLPACLFQIKTLTLVDFSNNCLRGSLPTTLCESTALQTLSLDGMCSAKACQTALLPGTYKLTQTLEGTIPACLFELPRLQTLHISGVGLSASLPANLTMRPGFADLALSHNYLVGDIPLEIQTRQWASLDLSYNLDGTLNKAFISHSDNATLKLGNNRLSGAVPKGILDSTGSVAILAGNRFSCDPLKQNLPQQDAHYAEFQCGSNTFNLSYYFWISAAGLLLVVCLLYTCRKRSDKGVNMYNVFYELFVHARTMLDVAYLKDAQGRELKFRIRRFKNVCAKYKLCVRLGFLVALFIVFILLPFYGLVSINSSTVSYKYAYRVSIIYLSGTTAAAVALVMLILLMLYTFCCFVLLLWRCVRECVEFEREIDYAPSSNCSRDSFSVKEHTFMWEKVLVHAVLIAVDMVVVVGVNAAFVFVLLYKDDKWVPLAQAALSLFKVGWGSLCSRTVHYLSHHVEFQSKNLRRGIITLLFAISLFNNIVVPCLVVMAIDTNCFYNLAIPGDDIESTYSYDECVTFRYGGCIDNVVITEQSSFSPPFIYSYQCSASFLTSYAPSVVYVCIISGFIIPTVRYCGYRLVRWLPRESCLYWLVRLALPYVLKPIVEGEPLPEKRGPVFDARQLLVTVLTSLGTLLTFGAAFPPLAVPIAVTIMSSVFFARLELKRLVQEATWLRRDDYIEAIDQDCLGVGSDSMLLRAVRMLIYLSFFFYTLFIFDTLGDAVGFGDSFWVLIVVPALPLALDWFFYSYSGTTFVRTRMWVTRSLSSSVATSKQLQMLRDIQLEHTTKSPMSSAAGSGGGYGERHSNEIDCEHDQA